MITTEIVHLDLLLISKIYLFVRSVFVVTISLSLCSLGVLIADGEELLPFSLIVRSTGYKRILFDVERRY